LPAEVTGHLAAAWDKDTPIAVPNAASDEDGTKPQPDLLIAVQDKRQGAYDLLALVYN
jgi:hypothetical protein